MQFKELADKIVISVPLKIIIETNLNDLATFHLLEKFKVEKINIVDGFMVINLK
jgi:hypothetical protein